MIGRVIGVAGGHVLGRYRDLYGNPLADLEAARLIGDPAEKLYRLRRKQSALRARKQVLNQIGNAVGGQPPARANVLGYIVVGLAVGLFATIFTLKGRL